MRVSVQERKTRETDVSIELCLDGGEVQVSTGVGCFDHMLNAFATHGGFGLKVNTVGDLLVDCHHTVEDIGIVFGKCLGQALGDKAGIKRYGSCILPMEEALVLCAVDISGRPYLGYLAEFTVEHIGALDTEMIEEFFRAVCIHGGLNLHIRVLAGKNNHHIAEAMFKAFARALDEAVSMDPRVKGVPSTKGMLEGSYDSNH